MSHFTALDSIPKSFGHYVQTRQIEKGSTCVVCEVIDKRSSKTYATKIMPLSEDIPRKLREAIQREVRVLRRIRNRHLCTLHDVMVESGFIYLVLENCSGGSLLQMLLEGRLSNMSEIRRVFRQVACAVKYLHDHDIAHGDIKVENIVFDSAGNAKLIDLGYCHEKKIACDSDKSGTLQYAAPELLKQGRYRTDKADVWSLGILLHVMITGVFPFPNGHDALITRVILSGKLHAHPKMQGGCRVLFKRMTSWKPEHRPSAADVLSNPWLTRRE
jgi:serine/threonine protein kinase